MTNSREKGKAGERELASELRRQVRHLRACTGGRWPLHPARPSGEVGRTLQKVGRIMSDMALTIIIGACAFVGACWFVAWGVKLLGAIVRLVVG